MDTLQQDATSLYRFYDAAGVLLYVGITRRGWHRFDEHSASKDWWSQVVTTRVEHFPTRDQARKAELVAIASESPQHNIADVPSGPRPRRKTRMIHGVVPCQIGAPIDAHKSLTCVLTSRYGFSHTQPLWLYWEVNGDPITDDYYVEERSAQQLYRDWRRKVKSSRERVYWYVEGDGVFESAQPGMYDVDVIDPSRDHWFGSYYQQPLEERSRAIVPLQCLPVIDKHWCSSAIGGEVGMKGGFMQEATGWKPQPFQRWVDLDDLDQRYQFRRRSMR